MSFIRDILKGLPAALGTSGYQIVLIDGAVYLEGVRILKITSAEMLFASGKETLRLTGADLKVDRLESDTLLITGKIGNLEIGGAQ